MLMRYKLLGKSGLRVSELCLGAMTFGQDWGSMLPGASKESAKKIFDSFVVQEAILLILQIYIKMELVKNTLVNLLHLIERNLFLLQNTPYQQILMIPMHLEATVRI